MAESFVQVSPDSTGKKIAAVVDDDSNYRQVVEIGGDGTDNFAQVTAGGALKTDASATTQPVSGTVAVSGTVTASVSGSVSVSNFPGTQAVTLPAGQAVELLDSGGTNKASISAGGALKVDGSGVTQPVSGTFWQSIQPVSGTVTANQGGAPWTVNIPTTASPSFGQQKVATGGTQVQLTSVSTPTVQGVVVQAMLANTNQVYVGLTGVTTTHDGTGNGWELQPGQCSPVIPVSNANLLFINSATSGSAVCWTAT